jgi:hypothetical protein
MAQTVKSTKTPAGRSAKEVSRAARQRRKQAVGKIPAKYEATRWLAKVGLATSWYLWRGARNTTVFTAKHGARAGRKVAGHTRTIAQERVERSQERSWDRRKPIQCVCGASFRNPQAANAHMVRAHFNEPPAWLGVDEAARKKGTGVRLVASNRGKKKRVVLPEQRRKTSGAHRERPDGRRENQAKVILTDAYRKKLDKIGETVMSENGAARNIGQAFAAWGDQRPRKLSELREIAVGLERAMAMAKDAMDSYERYLNRPGIDGGMGVAPEVTRGSFLKAKDGFDAASRAMTMHIATIESEYGAYIAAARRLPPPAIDLAR